MVQLAEAARHDEPAQWPSGDCAIASAPERGRSVEKAIVIDLLARKNEYADRLIGSIRRECIDHVIVFGERHLRHLLQSYLDYHNETRTHLSLNKDAPVSRAIEAVGRIVGCPVLGRLHHQYGRI